MKRFGWLFALLAFVWLACLSSALAATEEPEKAEGTQDYVKEFEEMFKSPYQEEDYYRADRLLITATGSLKPVFKAPSVATVITAEDIEKMGATTLDEVLETVAGVHVGRSTLQSLNPKYNIRGITTAHTPQVLTLVNNVPIKDMNGGGRFWNWRLPVSMISRIEVVRGPGSAVHGADAFAGTINIITKDGQEIDGTKAGMRVGSFNNSYEAWAQHGGTYGGWDVVFGLDWQKSDGDDNRIVTYDRQSLFDSWLSTDASLTPEPLNTSYDYLSGTLGLRRDDWTMRLWAWRQDDVGLGDQASHVVTPDSVGNIDFFLTDVEYNNEDLADDWDFGAHLYYLYCKQDIYYHLFPPGARLPIGKDGNIPTGFGMLLAGTLPNLTFFPDGQIGNPIYIDKHYSLDLTTFYTGFPMHTVRMAAGIKYMQQDTEQFKNNGPGVLNWGTPGWPAAPLPVKDGTLTNTTDTQWEFRPDEDRTLWFLSIQDEWSFARHWELTAGVRYDHYSDFGSTINPRAALVWETRPDLTTKFLYGQAFRPPSFAELYSQNNTQVKGNPNTDPETSETFELAFDYEPNIDFRTILSLFYYEIDGIIEFVPPIPVTAENSQDRQGEGFEIEATWAILDTLQLRTNFAYQRSEDKHTGEPVPNTPELQFFFNPHWAFLPDWSLDVIYNWVGNRRRLRVDPRPDIDDYGVVHFTVRRKNIGKHWDFAFQVRNLFDEDVREPGVYDSTVPLG